MKRNPKLRTPGASGSPWRNSCQVEKEGVWMGRGIGKMAKARQNESTSQARAPKKIEINQQLGGRRKWSLPASQKLNKRFKTTSWRDETVTRWKEYENKFNRLLVAHNKRIVYRVAERVRKKKSYF